MSKKLFSLPVLALALSACTLIPNYQTPELAVSESWPAGVASPQGADANTGANTNANAALATSSVSQIAWRDFFADKRLQELISLALQNNRDLRIAMLNVDRMQALYRIQRADLLPKINATGQEVSQRLSDDLRGPSPAISRQYAVGLSANAFELDFFGRIRSLNAQALENYLATQEAQRNAQLVLVSQVSSAYLNYLADNDHLGIARATLENQEVAYGLIEKSFAAGLLSELTLRQAQTSVESARIDLARYTSLLAQDENMLSVLLGVPAQSFLQAPPRLAALSLSGAISDTLPVGLSSRVLLQRPDIMQAEHALKAANANIGAARAAFFPTISLSASDGTSASELSRLFDLGTRVWSFVPQISLPIFQGGRTIANLDAAELLRDIQVAQYDKAIQNAFREVADALAERNTLDDRQKAQDLLTEATRISYRLAGERFRLGVARYLDVLDAQRSLYAAEQNQINVQLARYYNRITLYKALGGGTIEVAPSATLQAH